MNAAMLASRASELHDRLPTRVQNAVTLAIGVIRAIAVGNVSDRAMTLAAQAFTSILPVILLLTWLPGNDTIDRSIEMFGLKEGLTTADSGSYASFGVVGALMTLVSATSFARALERMYVGVWDVQSMGIRGWWRWLSAVLLLAIVAVAQAGVAVGFNSDGKSLVGALAGTFVLWTVAWAMLPRVLLSEQISRGDRWRLGLLTGAGLTAFVAVTQVAYGAVFASARSSFGVLGVVFAAIGWLFVFTAIVVVATIVIRVATAQDGV